MNISTINKTMLSFALVVFSLGFITQGQAQYTLYGDNVVINGDFSAADSAWEPNGGNGTANSITGSSVTYAGGGGGGSPGPGGSGGSGGGGTGGNSPAPNNKSAGTANTGGGGGGATGSSDTGMAGGSGIVVLRYRFTESV